jgi:hypothetical protein
LLILPLAWAFSPERPKGALPEAVVVVVATAIFLVPGAAALGSVTLPAALQPLTSSAIWPFVLLHQIVALLVIIVALLVAAWRDYAGSPSEAAPPVSVPGAADRSPVSSQAGPA